MAEANVLVISHDIVGPAMAGPGIRYVEISRALSHHFSVTLAVPQGSSPSLPDLRIVAYATGDWTSLQEYVDAADAVLLCGDTLFCFPELMNLSKPIIVDGYDPHTVESLLMNAHLPSEEQLRSYRHRLGLMRLQCLAGDFFICASEVQRDWWLGHLESHGRVNPYTVRQDGSLRRLIDVVPFGLPSQPFPSEFAIHASDLGNEHEAIVLWGGGLWEWLDPLTAVAAMPDILARVPSARLLFPGTRHPNPDVPEMPKVAACRALAEELGLNGDQVRFGSWVPRLDWAGYLARASVGLSLHPDTIETHLAFRSRVLDYVWAGLPMVVTRGDVTSQLVEEYQLGIVVEYGDTVGVADAVSSLLESRKSDFADGFARARAHLTWERATEPLVDFLRSPQRAPDKVALGSELTTLSRSVIPGEDVQSDSARVPAAAIRRRLRRLAKKFSGGQESPSGRGGR